MKGLKFSEPLPELILSGKKDTTWRMNDEKGITVDDMLSLQYNSGKEFAKAKVLWTKETTFGNLTEEDKEGNEKFASDEEMYKQQQKWYKTQTTPQTKVKVIKFRVL